MQQSEPERRKIPPFASIEEEVRFWDSHDLGEFEDELEPVEFEVAQTPRHSVTVSLDSTSFRRLVALAKTKGMGPSALARSWVQDALERALETEKDPVGSRASVR